MFQVPVFPAAILALKVYVFVQTAASSPALVLGKIQQAVSSCGNTIVLTA